MLSELSIKNFAIIDDLSVSFFDGLTVLSGETGAGKSIIINAVNLILGNRATSRLIRTGAETAEIEALFSIKEGSPIKELMEKNGYDSSEGLLIRRVVSRTDRHKIYINGRIGTIQILTEMTENLASISGQHAHQSLLQEDQHLLLLDQFGNLMPLREKVAEKYHTILPLIKKLQKTRAMEKNWADQIELLEFQKKEIEDACIRSGEDHSLEEDRLRLKHGEVLYKSVQSGIQRLYEMDGSVSEQLADIKKNMDQAVGIDTELQGTAEEIADIIYRVEDIAGTLRDYRENIMLDGTLLEEIEERIDFLNKLKRKYGGSNGTLEDIEAHYRKICGELEDVNNLSVSLETIEKELTGVYLELSVLSKKLSDKRKKAARKLAGKIEIELKNLEMSKTQFEVLVKAVPSDQSTGRWLTMEEHAISESGIDKAVFMIAPNVGEEMKPLAKIASGGELSRVVLAMKAILAETDSVETVVFDEVDAGIGGGTAEMVGKKILGLSGYHQVICITHLPQIAKFARHHYKIKKTVTGGRTSTSINPLSENDRVIEMARMLGGIELTQATMDHAREMLEGAVALQG